MMRDMNRSFLGLDDCCVEGPATKIINEPVFLFLVHLKAICQRRRDWFLKKGTLFETSEFCSLSSRVALMQLKRCWNGNHRGLDDFTALLLHIAAQRLQNFS